MTLQNFFLKNFLMSQAELTCIMFFFQELFYILIKYIIKYLIHIKELNLKKKIR